MPDPTLTLFVPGRLVNPTNARGTWVLGWKVSRAWRDRTALLMRAEDARRGTFRTLRSAVAQGQTLRVTLTPYVGRRLDDDGVIAACKPLRDELAELFLTHDGPTAGHTWVYAPQVVEHAKDRQGVWVEVSVRTITEATG